MPNYNVPLVAPKLPNTLMPTNNPLAGVMKGVAGGAAAGPWGAIIGGLLNIIPTIVQGGIGIGQLRKANLLEQQNIRPEASVMPAINQMVNYARGQTFAQDIPGGDIARNQIMGAAASGVKAASEMGRGSEAFGFLRDVTLGSQNQFSDIARQTAEYVAARKQDYMNTLPMLAQEQERVWNWNEAQPYLYAADTARRLRESGQQNIYGGVSNLFGSIAESVSSLWGKQEETGNKSDVTMDAVNKAIAAFEQNSYKKTGISTPSYSFQDYLNKK